MSNSIDEYHELSKWYHEKIADSKYLSDEFYFGFEVKDVELKLIDMQKEINKLKENVRLANLLIDKIDDKKYRQMVGSYKWTTKGVSDE